MIFCTLEDQVFGLAQGQNFVTVLERHFQKSLAPIQEPENKTLSEK